MIPPYLEKIGAEVCPDPKDAVGDADVVMALRIQRERFEDPLLPSLREYASFFGINQRMLSYAKPDAIVMIEYEELSNNPYKYTYEELKHRVHIERRGKKLGELKLDSYRLTRSQFLKKWGWGIHIDRNGKLALVGCETSKYKQLLNDTSVDKKRAYRINKR